MKTFKTAASATAMAAVLAAAAIAPTAAFAQVDERAKLILSAVGEVSATPDMASIQAGVVAEARTASAAMADQRERMTAVVEALKAAGVADADIQTTSLELTPVYPPYDYERNQQEMTITGYRAANRVTVRARDLARLGPTLDALVEAGANDISSISFDFSQSDDLQDAARRDAVIKLRERADLYASAAGVRVGRLLELSEAGGFNPYPIVVTGSRLMAEAASTPVEAGTMTLQVTVNATFEIVE
jgi:uncharacterized protein YggE